METSCCAPVFWPLLLRTKSPDWPCLRLMSLAANLILSVQLLTSHVTRLTIWSREATRRVTESGGRTLMPSSMSTKRSLWEYPWMQPLKPVVQVSGLNLQKWSDLCRFFFFFFFFCDRRVCARDQEVGFCRPYDRGRSSRVSALRCLPREKRSRSCREMEADLDSKSFEVACKLYEHPHSVSHCLCGAFC